MATVYKRTKGKHEPYTIQYLDHNGKRRTVQGFTDKSLSEQLAAKLENEALLRSSGLFDAVTEEYAEKKLAPITDHLTAFEESLTGNTPKHVRLTMTRVRRIINGCGFATLADVTPEPVQIFLRTIRKENNLGHRTLNHYLQAVDAFLNWCVVTKRLLSNPLLGMERLNTEVDIRRKRRALTADEVGQLVSAARSSGIAVQRFTGEQRARIYLISYMTGLRKNEIASLTPRSFQLSSNPATVTVEAIAFEAPKKGCSAAPSATRRIIGSSGILMAEKRCTHRNVSRQGPGEPERLL